MADAAAGGEEVDVVILRKPLDRRVLLHVGRTVVLDVVVEREDGLTRIVDLAGADRGELRDDGAGIVVTASSDESRRGRTHVMTCFGEMVTNSPE